MKIEEEVFVVLDDMSRFGLRRLHLLGAYPIDADLYLDQMEAIGGIAELKLEYVDDLGNYHLFLAWRFVMEAMFCIQIQDASAFQEAIGKAAVGYFRRFGVWPDRGVIRTGDGGRGTGEGEIKSMELRQEDGELVGNVMIERVGWMRAGDVGVYRKDASQE